MKPEEQEFEKWVVDRENEIFEKDKFKASGMQDDYIFQTLVFMGKASHNMTIANTTIQDVWEIPEGLKSSMKRLTREINEVQQLLREIREIEKGGSSYEFLEA